MAINLVNDNISTIEIQGKKYNIKAIPFHGTAAEWENSNYIPKDGEVIIYDVDENYNYKRIKIGDGSDIVSVLPFLDEDIASRIFALETWSQEIEEKIAYIDTESNENVENPDIEISGIIVDSKLSETSMNPVQNKVITEKINEIETQKADLMTDVETLALLKETGIVDPVSNSAGAIYTDNNETIYVL